MFNDVIKEELIREIQDLKTKAILNCWCVARSSSRPIV